MKMHKVSLVNVLKYIWWIMGLGVILFVVSQNIITSRELEVGTDFEKSFDRDIYGWYPESRVRYDRELDQVRILSEPLYMQVYMPIDFDKITVNGSITHHEEELKLGLKQKDGSWDFKNLPSGDFIAEYKLDDAFQNRNKLEFILSIPKINSTSSIDLINNWKFNFSR